MRVWVLCVGLLCVACGSGGDEYPRAWTLEVSPEAAALVEQVSWDPQNFFELVCTRAELIARGTGLEFDLDVGSGVVAVDGRRDIERGVLGEAARGSARADVHLVQLFNFLFGHAPGRVALTTYTMDEAAHMVAVIVVHEVGHALGLPHNEESPVMRLVPDLDAGARHAFTDAEIAALLR